MMYLQNDAYVSQKQELPLCGLENAFSGRSIPATTLCCVCVCVC